MAELYFENQSTKTRFKVVSLDKEAGTVTLIGKHQREFTEKYSKERFERIGYALVQQEAGAAPPPPSADAPPPPPPPPVAIVVDA